MKSGLGKALAVAFAVGVWAGCAWLVQPRCYATSDFYAFWAAARLADARMYDPDAVEALQRSLCPDVTDKRFIRPAFQALALAPLGNLSFISAYAVWFWLNVAACLGFLSLCGFQAGHILAAALYLPLMWSFGLGQDAPLIMLWFAAGTALLKKGKAWSGGALLALCMVKPAIFFLAPLVLAARKQYRALAGMSVTGAVLCCAAIPAAGWDWPVRFAQAALANEALISPNILGLAGLIRWLGQPDWLRVPLAALGAGLTLIWIRRLNLDAALCFAVAAGLVFGARAMIYDATFLLAVLLPRFSLAQAVAAGAALALVVTPVRPLVELASPVWLWLAHSSKATACSGADDHSQVQAP